jgi:queuine/archaeosine tRNA-ribosyltransferase
MTPPRNRGIMRVPVSGDALFDFHDNLWTLGFKDHNQPVEASWVCKACNNNLKLVRLEMWKRWKDHLI